MKVAAPFREHYVLNFQPGNLYVRGPFLPFACKIFRLESIDVNNVFAFVLAFSGFSSFALQMT